MELFSEAAAFAVRAHDGMRRKNNTAPYILHPLEAAAIVGTMTDDQQILAAAVLHDTVEDAGVAPEEIEARFGARVRELVMSETEDKRAELPPEQTWRLRKEESVTHLQHCGDLAVKMLYVGDKLSNLRAVHRDMAVQGAALWNRFNQKDPAMQHWYYRAIAEATRELHECAAWQEYDWLVREIFNERNE